MRVADAAGGLYAALLARADTNSHDSGPDLDLKQVGEHVTSPLRTLKGSADLRTRPLDR